MKTTFRKITIAVLAALFLIAAIGVALCLGAVAENSGWDDSILVSSEKVDDADSRFSYVEFGAVSGWSENTGAFNGTSHHGTTTTEKGVASFSFEFEGIGFDIVGFACDGSGLFITVDEGAPIAVSDPCTGAFEHLSFYRTNTLADGRHSVLVEVGEGGVGFGFDYLLIYGEKKDTSFWDENAVMKTVRHDDAEQGFLAPAPGFNPTGLPEAVYPQSYENTLSYGVQEAAGAWFAQFSFTGIGFNIAGLKLPESQDIRIEVDGVLYADRVSVKDNWVYQSTLFKTNVLQQGAHVVKIVPLYDTGSAGVAIDFVEIYTTHILWDDTLDDLIVEEYDDACTDWFSYHNFSAGGEASWQASCLNQTYTTGNFNSGTAEEPSYASFSFKGVGFEIVGAKYSPAGQGFDLFIDGVFETYVDCKGEWGWQASYYKTNTLENGAHTVKIIPKNDGDSDVLLDLVRVYSPKVWWDDAVNGYQTFINSDNPQLSAQAEGVFAFAGGQSSAYGLLNDHTAWTDVAGATLHFSFTGIGIDVRALVGSNQGKWELTLDGGEPMELDCHSGDFPTSQSIFRTNLLTDGEHTIALKYLGGGGVNFDCFIVYTQNDLDFDTNGLYNFQLPTEKELWNDTHGSLKYSDGWTTVSDAGANYIGGNYTQSSKVDSTVRFAFRGVGFILYAERGVNGGLLKIEVDGSLVKYVDLYDYVNDGVDEVFRFNHLENGAHTAEITVIGATPNIVGKGEAFSVKLDAVKILKGIEVDYDSLHSHEVLANDKILKFSGAWEPSENGVQTAERGAQVAFGFNGVGFELFAKTGEGCASAEVYIDGSLYDIVDLSQQAESDSLSVVKLGYLKSVRHDVVVRVSGEGSFSFEKITLFYDTPEYVAALNEVILTHDNAKITYVGDFGEAADEHFYNGTAHWSGTGNAYVEFTFTGSGFSWVGHKNEGGGRARMIIDGVELEGYIDSRSSDFEYGVDIYRITGLELASHTVKIIIVQDSPSRFSYFDHFVIFDYVETEIVKEDVGLKSSKMEGFIIGSGADGNLAKGGAGDAITFKMFGSGIQIFGKKAPDCGMIQIYVDGELWGTADCYAAAAYEESQMLANVTDLSLRTHRIKVVVADEKNPAASDSKAELDYFNVILGYPLEHNEEQTVPPVYPPESEDDNGQSVDPDDLTPIVVDSLSAGEIAALSVTCVSAALAAAAFLFVICKKR